MINPSERAANDQLAAHLKEVLPELLSSFFMGLVEKKFTVEQAFQLTRDYMYCLYGAPRRE